MSRHPHRTLKCSNCGVNLPLEEGQKVVVCEYCSTHTAVPPEFWKPAPAPAAPVHHPPVHQGQRVPASGTGKSPAAFVIIVISLVVAGSGAALYFVTSGGGGGALSNTVRGDVVGLVEGSAVVPSFEAVDGIRTARNISTTVEERWRPHGRTSTVSFTKVSADGSMNVSGDAESHISMTFYDAAALENVVPGQTSAKGAQITLSVINDYVAGFEGDANLTWADDIVYIDEYPSCDLKTLRQKAAEAGYPDTGFANVTFPEVPGELAKDGIDFALSFVRKDGDELKEKLEAMEWDTGPYRFYQFYVPNFDASDLPRYFRPDDCSPVDVKKLQEELIEELRKN
jgi:hypothetical protein